MLIMEYLPGDEYSVDAFRGSQAEIAIPRLRRVIRSGISFENVIEFRRDLQEATLGTARKLGLQSCFGLQFKLDAEGRPKVLECNPRVQGTMVASCFAGANIIWMAVREAMGYPVLQGSWSLTPAEFVRYWGGVGISGSDVHVI
jgi:carbamoyl-phosphate synthase large subunit